MQIPNYIQQEEQRLKTKYNAENIEKVLEHQKEIIDLKLRCSKAKTFDEILKTNGDGMNEKGKHMEVCR